MKASVPTIGDADRGAPVSDTGRAPHERFDDELVMDLERDQFVAETSRPVARASLSPRATAGLWALRVFVVLVSLMVIYTFFYELH
jgi:hypothetical protein